MRSKSVLKRVVNTTSSIVPAYLVYTKPQVMKVKS